MEKLKYGILAIGALGLVGCFLRLGHGTDVTFWQLREFDAFGTYTVTASYAVGAGMALLSILRPPMVRSLSIVAAVAFLFSAIQMRDVIMTLLRDGAVGARLMASSSLLGAVLALVLVVAAPKE